MCFLLYIKIKVCNICNIFFIFILFVLIILLPLCKIYIMATKLNKIVIREVELDNKDLYVSLNIDNSISFRFKNSKDELNISFDDLMNFLKNKHSDELDKKDGKSMINLNDFRSQYLIDGELDYKTKVKLELITVRLLNK